MNHFRNDVLKFVAFAIVAGVGLYLLDSHHGNRTQAAPPRQYVLDDPKFGVAATVIGESLCVRPDPDTALRGHAAAWAIRFEDREAVRNNMLPKRKAVQFRDGERVKVLDKREHVINDAGGWMNWSRIQSLDRADLPAAWIIDQVLVDK
jgi:hypothetical protein